MRGMKVVKGNSSRGENDAHHEYPYQRCGNGCTFGTEVVMRIKMAGILEKI